MELYKIGGILGDVGIGLLMSVVVVRLILTIRYVKVNGSRTLTEDQKMTMKKYLIPLLIASIVAFVASFVLFLL